MGNCRAQGTLAVKCPQAKKLQRTRGPWCPDRKELRTSRFLVPVLVAGKGQEQRAVTLALSQPSGESRSELCGTGHARSLARDATPHWRPARLWGPCWASMACHCLLLTLCLCGSLSPHFQKLLRHPFLSSALGAGRWRGLWDLRSLPPRGCARNGRF